MRSSPTADDVDMPAPESRDRGLVARIRAGDAAAFETLFRTYYDGLYAFIYRYVQSRAVAEELVQDVFLKIWDQRERWTVTDSVRSYLYAAARNHALTHLRRERLERQLVERSLRDADLVGLSEFAAGTERRQELGELTEMLQRAVDALPERTRLTITLRWQRQMRNAEIAAVMGISEKAVEVNIARAMRALREMLG